jgi:hypothetical protein
MFVFDGTTEEIAEVYQKLKGIDDPQPNFAQVLPKPGKPGKPGKPEGEEGNYVSLAQARLVLMRRPLSAEQLTVLKLLKERHPRLVSAAELRKAVSYTKAQLSGMMGAFGRRVSHTDGVKGKELFRWDSDRETSEYTYGLPDSVIEAMNIEGL